MMNNKMNKDVAGCPDAVDYTSDLAGLSLQNKLNSSLNRAKLNDKVVEIVSVISLNFAPGEDLSPENQEQLWANTWW